MQNEKEIKNEIKNLQDKQDAFIHNYIIKNQCCFKNDIEIACVKQLEIIQISKYLIKDASFFENLNGIKIGRYGHFLKSVYVITNKKIKNASIMINDCLVNTINSDNIKFLHNKENLDIYKLNLFEEDEDLMLLLTNPFVTYDIIISYENNIDVKNLDTTMFGCEFINIKDVEFCNEHIKPIKYKKIKTFGNDNILMYDDCYVRYNNHYYDTTETTKIKNFKPSINCHNWIETYELDNFL